jgi:hypothetical protein
MFVHDLKHNSLIGCFKLLDILAFFSTVMAESYGFLQLLGEPFVVPRSV